MTCNENSILEKSPKRKKEKGKKVQKSKEKYPKADSCTDRLKTSGDGERSCMQVHRQSLKAASCRYMGPKIYTDCNLNSAKPNLPFLHLGSPSLLSSRALFPHL